METSRLGDVFVNLLVTGLPPVRFRFVYAFIPLDTFPLGRSGDLNITFLFIFFFFFICARDMILWFWSGHNWVTSKGHLYSVVFVFIGKKIKISRDSHLKSKIFPTERS